ncbi:MAG TPA: nucleotidyltransferase domain-containing protein [Thermomicrobiales bacterium]|nr:nucleotidyltransferase domain-containing protein [Thermomicrobiales bacterium]
MAQELDEATLTARADAWIGTVVARIAAEPGVRAVLLGGSRAAGRAWPRSDVDLLVVVDDGPARKDIFDVDWLTFDIAYTTPAELEEAMAADGMRCHACRELATLAGDPAYAERIEAAARRLYPRHVPGAREQDELRERIRGAAHFSRSAVRDGGPVALAEAGGGLVWLAAKICLATVGIGPLREVYWHDALRAALSLPFDAATPFARWHAGDGLDERLDAAFALAALALGEPLARTPSPDGPPLAPPALARRAVPDPAEAVELHRQILYGFGKFAKAEWTGDPVRRALEAGVITWFAVPATLTLAGIAAPTPGWWLAAPRELALSFDAVALYARALTGEALEERIAAAHELGRRTMRELEAIFEGTEHARKYRREL